MYYLSIWPFPPPSDPIYLMNLKAIKPTRIYCRCPMLWGS